MAFSSMKRVMLHLVTWNGIRYLPELFASLYAQTYKEFSVRILDNHSSDGTWEWLSHNAAGFVSIDSLERGETNVGFAGGHNALFLKSHNDVCEYLFLVNQDLKLDANYISELVKTMDENQNAGIGAGILLNFDGTLVDSAGLRIHRTRSAEEIDAGIIYTQCDLNAHTVFGVSGTLPCLRIGAAKTIALNNELFDAHFDSYKEDVDLAYRLQSAGFDALLVPRAIAYHDRSVAQSTYRSTRSHRVRRNSYRNHLFTLVKNEYLQNAMRDFFWIVGYEFSKFFYLLFREPSTLLGLLDFFKLLPTMLLKRRAISALRKRSASSIYRWILK